ncbi:MAG: FHA domain-containing protein [Oscillospiraceae bacterium]|nr:FHA domain-containing protein [Oscillospiraceae bacterium]
MLLTNRITGEKHQLTEEEYSIGRSETCEIVIKEPTLSRKHARITRAGDDWFIEDLFSTNGVTLNGEKITAGEKVRLSPDDRIVLGTTVSLLFEREEEEEERTVGVQFFRKEKETEAKERPEPPEQHEPEVAVRPAWNSENAAPVRPLWAEEAAPVKPAQQPNAAPAYTVRGQNAAPVKPAQQPNAAPAYTVRGQNAAPVQPRQQPKAAPGAAPLTFKEYVNKIDPGAKKSVTAAAIVLYVCCGITLIAGIVTAIQNDTPLSFVGVLIDIAAVLPLAILMHTLKSKGCAIALVCVTAVEFLATTAMRGQVAGFLPLIGAISALVALVHANKNYKFYLGK